MLPVKSLQRTFTKNLKQCLFFRVGRGPGVSFFSFFFSPEDQKSKTHGIFQLQFDTEYLTKNP